MKNIVFIFSFIFLTSCSTSYEFKFETPKTVAKNGKFTANVNEINGKLIDSVLFSVNGKKSSRKNTFDFSNKRLGNHEITAIVFYNGKNKKLVNNIIKLANVEPVMYDYQVVNTYNHDSQAFTQGLEFYKGELYETTGIRGESTLRKVDLKTGKVIKSERLPVKYFGEGMTIFNDKIHWLTWEAKQGFVYNLETFKQEKSFNYGRSVEGWGLTHNETQLIKSDGTKKIWFLNPKTYKEERFIDPYTNIFETSNRITKLNELEYVNGKIYANIWQKNYILIINPKDGTVEGFAFLDGLQKLAGQRGDANILNGIAYNNETDKLYVTGKRWNKLFEIKLIKK